MVKVGKRNT